MPIPWRESKIDAIDCSQRSNRRVKEIQTLKLKLEVLNLNSEERGMD